MTEKLIPQRKARVIEKPGFAVAIVTENGDSVVLTPSLAAEVAEVMRFVTQAQSGAILDNPAKGPGLVQ